MQVPSEPTHVQSFMEWQFVLYLSARTWDGMMLGKAEVRKGNLVECTFQIARVSTSAEIKDRLTEECISWVTQQSITQRAPESPTR